ncbi:DUF3473 domain-containing protein [Paenibacillus pinisoli]|uniref:DUF3473 domain-containing protein n=2 Tax=Paenibacillus pinisoli TaxID=1276110 RepID=A0A3A6Q210_9BACL|nr:DUF3473 domain-containing protein [Paenibacillus pinisoli]
MRIEAERVKPLDMIFTVDLEDWFCSPELSLADWKRYPFRLEKPTHLLLDMLDEKNAKGTFFVLGWIAEHKPGLVKEIHRRGHEIASHGYAHRLVYKQSRLEFKEDIRHSKTLLEQLTGSEVRGYRAPCFSMTEWGLELLEEEGFNYDSSLMPHSFAGDSGGLGEYPNAGMSFPIKGKLIEYPLPVQRIGNLHIPWGGGGYYRLYPYELFRYGVKSWLKRHDYFLFYIHPYDLDKEQPRIFRSTWSSSFRRYYGLGGTRRKIERMLTEYECTSIEHYEHQAEGMVSHG